MTILGAFSCSVDQDELDLGSDQILEANAHVEVEGCETMAYDFGDAGIIEVTNNNEGILFVTVIANEGYDLDKTRVHVVNQEEGFPTVGQGNLPPSRMEWVKSFEWGVDHYTFEIDLANYGQNLSIASFSTFSGEGGSNSYWAGDIDVKYGSWSYLNYDIQTCQIFEDPCNFISADLIEITLTLSESRTLMPSIDGIRNYYIGLIEEPVSRFGTLNPAASTLRLQAIAQNGLGEFTSTYTVSHGECTDSVTITITVIPDP